jgi:hypothetical protein
MYDFISIDNYDKVVFQIAAMLKSRSEKGITKYGVTLDRTDLNIDEWIQHAIEECLDQALYLQRIKNELKNTKQNL